MDLNRLIKEAFQAHATSAEIPQVCMHSGDEYFFVHANNVLPSIVATIPFWPKMCREHAHQTAVGKHGSSIAEQIVCTHECCVVMQAQPSQDTLAGDAVESLLDPVNGSRTNPQVRTLVGVLAVFKERTFSEQEHRAPNRRAKKACAHMFCTNMHACSGGCALYVVSQLLRVLQESIAVVCDVDCNIS
jgi:hypothetical protein